jgi:hypothetical protein
MASGTALAPDVEMRTSLRTLPVVVSLAFAAAASAIGCAPTVDVHAVVFPRADPARYQTFSLSDADGAPNEHPASAQSAEVRRRVALLVTDFLQARGYGAMPEGGDMIVRIAAGRRERETMPAMPLPRPMPKRPTWLEEHEREEILEGILIIDILDGKTLEPVWHGAARVDLDKEGIDDPLLRRATSKVMASFPWSRAVRSAPP